MKKSFIATVACLVLGLVISTGAVAAEEPSFWASDSIERLKAEEKLASTMFSGYGENINRKDFAYLIYNLYEELTGDSFSSIEYKNPNISFSDTSDRYVLEVARSGIINGYGDGRYGPYDKITREQMAMMYVKTLEKADVYIDRNVENVKFKDIYDISSWAMASVKISSKMDIIQGLGDGRIDPKGNSTREASLVVYTRIVDRYIGNIGDKEYGNPVYRALLIGNKNYQSGYESLEGSFNDLDRMESTLRKSRFGENSSTFESIVKEKDLTSKEMISSIEEHLSDVKEGDITYFYYSGHGGKDHLNRSSLVGVDRGFLSVDELEKALNKVPGQKVVILDACNSGGFIAKGDMLGAKNLDDFNEGVIEVFRSRLGYLNSNGYKVITASSSDESSYEIRYPDGWGGEFTRKFTDGAGYKSLLSDIDKDGEVTLSEIYSYTSLNVRESSVRVFPSNDQFVIASQGR